MSERIIDGAFLQSLVEDSPNGIFIGKMLVNDNKMPVSIQFKYGIETARAIRQKVGQDVPIIVISAYDWTIFRI